MSGSETTPTTSGHIVFGLGRLLITPGAKARLEAMGLPPFVFLDRHRRNDWGDLDQEDKELNDLAARTGDGRIFSSYYLDREGKSKLWIITEADRSATTALLPSEY